MAKRKNKGIHVKHRKDRNCWEVVEYIRGKLKRHATSFSCRSDAEKKLAEILAERHNPIKDNINPTLGELMVYYIKEHVPTLARPDTALKCFDRLIPFWGEVRLSDLSESKSLAYIEYRKKEFEGWQDSGGYKKRRKLRPQTTRRELEQLQAVIGKAHKNNKILFCPYIWKPEKGQSRDRWLTKKEAAKLIRAAKSLPKSGEYLHLFVLLGLYTGARSEAILSLRWHQVDFKNGFINFHLNQKSAKKKYSRVPMPRRLKRELLMAKRYGTDLGYVVHNEQKRIGSVKNSFSNACKKAGLKDVTAHTMRHTAVSWMVQNGVAFSTIGKYVGMTTQMVENVYGHLEPEHLKQAVESYG